MNREPRLPRALSLTEIQPTAGGAHERWAFPSADPASPGSGERRATLSLRNIAHPLPLPVGAELISLTTFDGRLVILTSKGPYIRRDSRWEKVLASQPDPEAD